MNEVGGENDGTADEQRDIDEVLSGGDAGDFEQLASEPNAVADPHDEEKKKPGFDPRPAGGHPNNGEAGDAGKDCEGAPRAKDDQQVPALNWITAVGAPIKFHGDFRGEIGNRTRP